ncbi:MAG: helix-turn-helix transcriptional regulator [Bacilli bacterium]|nr:helix-turn-helix transcriptional regulator [Bacilli bacterium]
MLNNVKKYREDIGLSQSDLAIKSQVSRATISDLENNKEVNLTTKVLLKIAKALNKTVTDVFFIK